MRIDPQPIPGRGILGFTACPGRGHGDIAADLAAARSGVPAAKAIAQLRAARPGSIETAAQRAWVEAGPGLPIS